LNPQLGVDAGTRRIVASALTTSDIEDASQVGPLLDQVADPIALFTADGAYDQDGVDPCSAVTRKLTESGRMP
jgi:hypothetical protein